MCLTIPARIIGRDKNKFIIQENNESTRAASAVSSGLKKGDWVLCINDLILKKISKKDAKDIIGFLESARKTNVSKLDKEFRKIIQASKTRDLTKKEIVYLLNTEGAEKQNLFSEANLVRQEHIKDFICIHGIIEFSNFCQNDCHYCGLRSENKKLQRYRMSIEEIVKTAEKAVKEKGYKLLVLQSGEDPFHTDAMLVEIIKKIKEKCQVFIFMSVGERSREAYLKMKKAGASGALLRFETSNPKLFKRFHPHGKNLKNRLKHLKIMKEMGYFIATGSMIGLPGQTIDDLASDIVTIKKLANMASFGPFIPCENTPLAREPRGNPELNLKMISVLRLLMPGAKIPVTTAMETLLGERGRRQALLAGANSLMFNLTPAKYRPLYKIYPDKFFKKEETWEKYGLFKYEESYKMLEERMWQDINKK